MHLVQGPWCQAQHQLIFCQRVKAVAESRRRTYFDQIRYFRLSYFKHARIALTYEPFLR